MAADVDRWVVRQAGDLARRGHAVAVNLSGRSLGDATVLDEIRAVVGAGGMDPGAVRFEVTKTSGVDQRIVAAIVRVAEHLGLTTVAEGVEEERTLALLADMGVTCAQGYAIGRPGRCALGARRRNGAAAGTVVATSLACA